MGTRGRRLLSLLGAGALVVALGVWLLTREAGTSGPARDASVLSRGRAPGEAAASGLPAATAPGATPESLAAFADAAPGAAADAPTAGSAPATLPGEEALFTGRVVDERGAPIADALVMHVPSHKLRWELGLVAGKVSGTMAWDRLAQARTAADGTFAIAARDLPAEAGRELHQDGRVAFMASSQPELVVRHPAFAVLVHPCTSFRSGACDVGTLVLGPCGTLIGRIVDVDGIPVPGATLRLEGLSVHGNDLEDDDALLRLALDGAAGPDGRFVLSGFPTASLQLDIRQPDFAPKHLSASTRAGETTDTGDVLLVRGNSIDGVVLDAFGQPIAGAGVLARASHLRIGAGEDSVLIEFKTTMRSGDALDVRTHSGERGEFHLGTLNQTHYAVFADAAGREPACVRDVAVGSGDVVLRLLPQATLLLTVVDATSEVPVAGVSGTAVRRSGSEMAAREGFDPKLEVLAGSEAASGSGMLLVQRAGPVRTEVTVSAPGYETRGFVLPGVQPGEQLVRTLKLRREALISGHVLMDGTRAPVADAVVTLGPPAESRVKLSERTASTDAEGAFRFGELHNGDWTLTVRAPGFLDSTPRPLGVKAEQVRDDIEVLLQRGAQLDVLLLGADGAPAAGREVVVRIADAAPGDSPWKVFTDAEGHAPFETLPPAAMTVSSHPGAEASVTLSVGQPAAVTLVLRRPPRLRGRVTAGGQPVAGARIAVFRRFEHQGTGQSGYMDEGAAQATDVGAYALTLSGPGQYLLMARDPSGDDAWCSPPASVTVDWDQEQHADLAFGGARVTGEVVDAVTRQPVAGASMLVRPHSSVGGLDFQRHAHLLQSEARAGDDGRFALEHVQPGPFQLTASAKGYAKLVLDSLTAVEGDTVEVPRLELSPGTLVKGVVRTASGKPLPPGLRVSLRSSPDAQSWTQSSVAADGSWQLVGGALTPGIWTVCVERQELVVLESGIPDAPLTAVQVPLAAGETKVVDLVLDQ